jgi:hypothetical protein
MPFLVKGSYQKRSIWNQIRHRVGVGAGVGGRRQSHFFPQRTCGRGVPRFSRLGMLADQSPRRRTGLQSRSPFQHENFPCSDQVIVFSTTTTKNGNPNPPVQESLPVGDVDIDNISSRLELVVLQELQILVKILPTSSRSVVGVEFRLMQMDEIVILIVVMFCSVRQSRRSIGIVGPMPQRKLQPHSKKQYAKNDDDENDGKANLPFLCRLEESWTMILW